MPRKCSPAALINFLILGSALGVFPSVAAAQRHGEAGMSGGGMSGVSRPTGVKEEDSLKDFHRAIAMQATSEQTAEFQALVKSMEAAKTQLQALVDQLHKENGAAAVAPRSTIGEALENARSESKKFEQGFSAAQKSGLKDFTKRLAKADSSVEQEAKRLDEAWEVKAARPEVAARAESLDKALTNFYDQQLALGREMSITLASGHDEAFTLPPVNHPVRIENRTITVTESGALSQISAQGGQRTFRLELTTDLSDLQQNITELLRARLDTSETCGQRVALREATLMPSAPATLLVVRLHFERWTCPRGQQSPNELAEGDGTVQVKLTATLEKPNTLKVTSTFGRIDATGLLDESLRSGSLGENLRDTAAQLVLAAAQSSSDLKTALPPAVQNGAVIQGARFQDAGVGSLSLLLDGQIEVSNEQADQLAAQLNQALSAQGAPSR